MGPSFGSRDEWHAAPKVCMLPDLNFTMISQFSKPRLIRNVADRTMLGVFHFGLIKFEEITRAWSEQWSYYPPFEFEDRLEHLVLPLLRNLGRDRVDLVSFSSLLWDQVHWRAEAKTAAALPDSMLAIYAERLDAAIKAVASAFPSTLTILWRTAQ